LEYGLKLRKMGDGGKRSFDVDGGLPLSHGSGKKKEVVERVGEVSEKFRLGNWKIRLRGGDAGNRQHRLSISSEREGNTIERRKGKDILVGRWQGKQPNFSED